MFNSASCQTPQWDTLSAPLTRLLFEVKEELLVEDEGDAADLLDFGLCSSVPVDEVGRDGDRQLPPELLPFETWEKVK